MKAIVIPTLAALALGACAPTVEPDPTPQASNVTGTLFVANKRGNTLSKIDLSTGEMVGEIDSCENPHELATSPDGAHVALACYGETSLDIFATATLERVKRIDLGANARPHGIVWHANGDLYATAEGRQSIFWVREPMGKAELFEYGSGKQGTHMLTVAPSGNHAWTTDLGSKTVTMIDLKTRRAPRSIEVGIEPEGIWLEPDGDTLWVSARGSNKAFALDPETLAIRSEVDTGAFPLRIAVRPQGDFAVTSDLVDGSLTVIDTATAQVTRTIEVSGSQEPFQVTILFSPDGERVYVAETGTDTVAEVDFASGEVLRRLKAGEGGDGLAILR